MVHCVIFHKYYFIIERKIKSSEITPIFLSWMVYDQLYDSWEPYANLRDSDQLNSLSREKNLTQLIPSKFC